MQSKMLHNSNGQRTFAVRKQHDPESGLALVRTDA